MEKEALFMNKNENLKSKEGPLSPEILNKIKADLLLEKESVEKKLDTISKIDNREADNRSAQFPEYGDKADENAQEINDFTTVIATQSILEKSLKDIDGALSRIEDGTYGVCKYCKNPINEKRLVARPTAGSCINCKTTLQEND